MARYISTRKPLTLTPLCTVPGETSVLCCANRAKPKRHDTARNKLSGWTTATEASGATTAMFFAIKGSWRSRVRLFEKAGYLTGEIRKDWVRKGSLWLDVNLMQKFSES